MDKCNKKNRPQACIECDERKSFVANQYSTEITCKYGKERYQMNPNYLLYGLLKGK